MEPRQNFFYPRPNRTHSKFFECFEAMPADKMPVVA